jgi:acyl-CoA synthetase (AMP-forming)/AMP-acid ligase II
MNGATASTGPASAAAASSIVRGGPLREEAGLGTLTLPGFLREVVAAHAGRQALVQPRPDGSTERWTYADLGAQATAVARSLVAGRLGKGERVGVLMTNRAEFVAAVFGVALAGGVAVPLSTFSTAEEMAFLLRTSAISVLLFEPLVLRKDFLAMLRALEPAIDGAPPGELRSGRFPYLRRLAMLDAPEAVGCVEPWDRFLESGEGVGADLVDERATEVSPSDPGMLFFSSGTTGRPKGILSAQRGVAIQMWRMKAQQGLDADVRMWTANGFFWSGNFAMVVGGTLAAGGAIVLQSTFRPDEALALMARERVDFLFAWPHQWKQLVDAPNWLDVDLSAMRYVDAASPIGRHPTIETTWNEPRHCYGNTETFTLSTAYPAGTTREEAQDSHGLPLPGNIIMIVDPATGTPVPMGERGEIAVKGPTLMLGYLGVPPEETFDEQGFFRSGDAGRFDEAGRLYWEGRLNDIIKTGGANVSPVEVDEVVRLCPGVKVAQTVGIPHETLGELVVTCIVPQDDADVGEEAVRAFVAERLASYKTPRRVLRVTEAELAMTGSAKVKTADLRALAARRIEQEAR